MGLSLPHLAPGQRLGEGEGGEGERGKRGERGERGERVPRRLARGRRPAFWYLQEARAVSLGSAVSSSGEMAFGCLVGVFGNGVGGVGVSSFLLFPPPTFPSRGSGGWVRSPPFSCYQQTMRERPLDAFILLSSGPSRTQPSVCVFLPKQVLRIPSLPPAAVGGAHHTHRRQLEQQRLCMSVEGSGARHIADAECMCSKY